MGHWYREDGSTAYTVPRATGKGERDTTLADAKKLNLRPSVTTVMAMAAKPGLETWKEEQILTAAVEWPFTYGDDIELWKKQIRIMSRQVAKTASEEGNRIHDGLEKCFKGNCLSGDKIIDEARLYIAHNFKMGNDWVAEKSFCQHGVGGKVDLHHRDGNGHGVIIDFKTKNTTDVAKMKGYDEHCIQLAAYRRGLDLPKAECYNMFISTVEPGLIVLKKWTNKELERGLAIFDALTELWYLKNKMERQV